VIISREPVTVKQEETMASDSVPGGPPAEEGAAGSPFRDVTLSRPGTVVGSPARAVFGQVMGLVAVTIGFTALGAYLGRNLSGGAGLLFFIAAFACIFGLQFATARGREQLAVGLLFGLGLALGLAVAPVIHVYAKDDPAALWQAAGATAATVGALGAIGYATRRDLSSWARFLFWALAALIVFGVVLIFVNIPHANVIYAVLGIVIFGGYTIFDFNRLRQADMNSAVPIAASIFLDVFNIFLFFLELFGGEGRN
jgi:FtsH-binding integral membrane protein